MAQSKFGMHHPLYQSLATLAALRGANAALRGGEQVVRADARTPGIFAVSRLDPNNNSEVVVAFNTSMQAIDVLIEVDPRSGRFHSLHGSCAESSAAPGSYRVQLAPLDFIICAASS
jgi:hypothetical protein